MRMTARPAQGGCSEHVQRGKPERTTTVKKTLSLQVMAGLIIGCASSTRAAPLIRILHCRAHPAVIEDITERKIKRTEGGTLHKRRGKALSARPPGLA